MSFTKFYLIILILVITVHTATGFSFGFTAVIIDTYITKHLIRHIVLNGAHWSLSRGFKSEGKVPHRSGCPRNFVRVSKFLLFTTLVRIFRMFRRSFPFQPSRLGAGRAWLLGLAAPERGAGVAARAARLVDERARGALPAGARLRPAQQAVPARAAAERVGLARGAEVGAALVLAGLAPRHPAPALPAPRHPVDLVELVQRLPGLPALVE